MENKPTFLEQFETLKPIEPSADWSGQLFQRLEHSQQTRGTINSNKLILVVVGLIIIFNIISFSNRWMSDREQQTSLALRDIATEYLVSTNSSSF